MKNFFLKAYPVDLNTQKTYPSLPVPSQPALTRWSAWLNAVIFYAQNLDYLRNVFNTFDNLDLLMHHA